MILRAKVANISCFCVLLPQKNAKSITFYVIFTVQGVEIEEFCVILQRASQETHIMLASQNELAPRKRRNEQITIHKEYAHLQAQTSPLWIVAVQGQFWEWWVCAFLMF